MSSAGTGAPDVAVIGAGIVGLACAAELARRGSTPIVIETHAGIARETSSRNSEVVHAGIYYPPDSLKARLCVEGRERLYARCRELDIPHRRIGKLVVATQASERSALEDIAARAEASGAGALSWLDAAEVGRREPRVRAHAGLWSPRSGIVDAHALAASYQAELESLGGALALHTRVTGLEPRADGWSLRTESDRGERFDLEVPRVVNAAGLWSDRIAELAGLDVDALGWRLRWCKGDYFGVAPRLGALTRHLVYPVPAAAGLGIHVTLDLGGRYRLGPDVEYVDALSYRIDPAKAERFARAAARYLPEIRPRDLSPELAGIRPKLQGPGEAFRDFVIRETGDLGAPGLVCLIGIESPGLTASAAIARLAADLLQAAG